MQTIELYINAIDLAKERKDVSNQEKILLNRFKILLLNDAVQAMDRELKQMEKVTREALHHVRELAESCFEDMVRHLDVDENERDKFLTDGKQRADIAESFLTDYLIKSGLMNNN